MAEVETGTNYAENQIKIFNEMFPNRYTDEDEEYVKTCSKPIPPCPCVEGFRPKNKNFDRNRGGRGGYRGNRGGQGHWRGGGDRYSQGQGQSWQGRRDNYNQGGYSRRDYGSNGRDYRQYDRSDRQEQYDRHNRQTDYRGYDRSDNYQRGNR